MLVPFALARRATIKNPSKFEDARKYRAFFLISNMEIRYIKIDFFQKKLVKDNNYKIVREWRLFKLLKLKGK